MEENKPTYNENERPKTNSKDANIVTHITRLIKQTDMYLKDAPNHEKYALCNKIREMLYEMYDLAVEAYKRTQKKSTLDRLDITHERLRMLYYLYFELGYFSYKRGKANEADAHHRFSTINRMHDEIGRMIGGWIKSQKTKDEK